MLLIVLASGCGGYAGDHPPVGGPGDFPVAGQTSAIPQEPGAVPTQAQTQTVPKEPVPSNGVSAPPTPRATAAGGQVCTLVGKLSSVSFKASAKIRSSVTSFRATLTQGALSRTAWTPADPDHTHGMPLVRGVLIANGTYTFVLGGDGNPQAALPGAWNAEAKARLLIEALGSDGRTIYQQSKTFSFTKSYPNGKACDKTPAISFLAELAAADQFGPLPTS
jgi:hypothetical protein